jgi:tetratricopeptide (TPR) repeat protein
MPRRISCPVCGNVLLAGRCVTCDARRLSRFVHRELILIVVLAGAAGAGFLATRAAAAADHRLRQRQASAWFDAGRGHLAAGRLDDALGDLRRAVARDRDNRRYRLALASALVASGRDEEARGLLLALRDAQPEEPETNLQLARLEGRAGNGEGARRYYEGALAALWRPEQAARRRTIRLELIDALLTRQQHARALAELLVLASNVPDTPRIQTDVARRFLLAGDPGRAQAHFLRVLRVQSGNRDALAGAGEASFALADYSSARRYLTAVPEPDARLADMRDVARLVLAGDPLAPRLPAAERRRRLRAAVDQATVRLEQCLGGAAETSGELESLQPRATQMRALLVRRNPPRDVVDDGVDLVHRIEAVAARHCAAPASSFDRALLLIGRRHGFEDA